MNTIQINDRVSISGALTGYDNLTGRVIEIETFMCESYITARYDVSHQQATGQHGIYGKDYFFTKIKPPNKISQ